MVIEKDKIDKLRYRYNTSIIIIIILIISFLIIGGMAILEERSFNNEMKKCNKIKQEMIKCKNPFLYLNESYDEKIQ